ncbi:MAG: hypothetical protein ACOYEV_12210 [Candidatus Nanopelagicales bacterium]
MTESAATSPRTPRRGRPAVIAAEVSLAARDPVAQVALLLDLPHLDRLFDYAVPAALAERAVPGVRVRVRFSGRLVDGFLMARRSSTEHPGSLTPLKAVVGALPVLTPEIAELVRAVAARYAGTFSDVVRSAVPPRHAAAEARVLAALAAQECVPAPGPGEGPARVPGDRADELFVRQGHIGAGPSRVPDDWQAELVAGRGRRLAGGPSRAPDDRLEEDAGGQRAALGDGQTRVPVDRRGEPLGARGRVLADGPARVAVDRRGEPLGARGRVLVEGPSQVPVDWQREPLGARAGDLADGPARVAVDRQGEPLGARGRDLVEGPSRVPDDWLAYEGAERLFAAVRGRGEPRRVVWTAGPTERPFDRFAELVAAGQAADPAGGAGSGKGTGSPKGTGSDSGTGAGRGAGSAKESGLDRGAGSARPGAIIVVPDLAAVKATVEALGRAGVRAEQLHAELGPQARYSAFLRILTGQRRVVVGTRNAVFAPVSDAGLIVVWNELDDSLQEPLAPGWHVREVAALRAAQTGASLVVGSWGMSCESANLLRSGWASALCLPRGVIRERMPRIVPAGEPDRRDPLAAQLRLPGVAVAALREGLVLGHVLVSVPRAGYRPGLACAQCRERADCRTCGAPLVQSAGSEPACREHGPPAPPWRCPLCGGERLRATAVGAVRTAEEFGRSFPGVRVVGSWGGERVAELRRRGESVLVVATPGAEPDPGPLGFAVAVVLDAAVSLTRPGLRTGEETVDRWLRIAGLVRRGSEGGQVVLVGPANAREIQAMIRWDPLGFAARELAERAELRLPPAVRVAVLTGEPAEAAELAAQVQRRYEELAGEQAPIQVAGPLGAHSRHEVGGREAGGDQEGWILTVPIAAGASLARALTDRQAVRSAAKRPVVASRMDPRSLG